MYKIMRRKDNAKINFPYYSKEALINEEFDALTTALSEDEKAELSSRVKV